MREKKVDSFQLSWRILEIVKRKETLIKMAASNVFIYTQWGLRRFYQEFDKAVPPSTAAARKHQPTTKTKYQPNSHQRVFFKIHRN